MGRRERKAYKQLKADNDAQERVATEQAKKQAKADRAEQARADWDAKSPQEKKKFYLIGAAIAAVVVIVITVASVSGGSNKSDEPVASTRSSETSGKAQADLGIQVKDALLSGNGVSQLTDLPDSSPGQSIADISELNSSTVRIRVQDGVDKANRKSVGEWTIKTTCSQVKDLDTVVVTGASGVDTNVFKRGMALPKDCR